MHNRKAGIAFLALGAVLIISALLLLRSHTLQDRQAGEYSLDALDGIQAAIAENSAAAATPQSQESPEPSEEPEDESGEMKTVTIDGNDYIGYLSIPELELVLPVISDWGWDYNRLQIAPCRQQGSTKTDDIVIAAHNYDSHFGKLKDLSLGDSLSFTDVMGKCIQYELKKLETVDPHKVDYVLDSGYDLVLYTCTYGGEFRVVGFFDRTEDTTKK